MSKSSKLKVGDYIIFDFGHKSPILFEKNIFYYKKAIFIIDHCSDIIPDLYAKYKYLKLTTNQKYIELENKGYDFLSNLLPTSFPIENINKYKLRYRKIDNINKYLSDETKISLIL